MAIVALQQGVRPYQWEPVLVITNLLQRDLPPLHRMASFAVSAELAAMNVCMTVSASSTNILEDRADMTFCAAHLLVHSAQWIAGMVVIELWIRSDRCPAGERMTISTGCRNRTVWIGDFGLGSTHGRSLALRGLLQSRCCNERD